LKDLLVMKFGGTSVGSAARMKAAAGLAAGERAKRPVAMVVSAMSKITDLLLDVDAQTGFSEAFTNLRTGAPCVDRIGLMNVLLAEGVNLGLRKMAAATNTHSFWELLRIARWHVEGGAYDRALAMIVEAHAALPMAAFWGQGLSASSDGQFFLAAEQGEAMNMINAKYGNLPGLKGYSHVSDQYAPFATQVIPATVSEAPYILDGLLMNDAGRRVRLHFADTGGFTDHVFAACALAVSLKQVRTLIYFSVAGALAVPLYCFRFGSSETGRLGIENSSLANPNDLGFHLLMCFSFLLFLVFQRRLLLRGGARDRRGREDSFFTQSPAARLGLRGHGRNHVDRTGTRGRDLHRRGHR